MTLPLPFRSGDALVIEDVQNDFLPGGALVVPHSDEIVPILNRYLAHFGREQVPVFATRDWHPANHSSFHAQGGPWPVHCVMHTHGAAFPANLDLPSKVTIVSKASDPAREAYSSYSGTDFEEKLRAAGVKRICIGGLATDYCVLHTARDALRRGFGVVLLRDGTRAINLENDDGEKAEAEMYQLGAVPFELGTMARWRPEAGALLRFARANPRNVVFLLDTYNTEAAAAKVVRLAPVLSKDGITIKGVRLDSGNLAMHAWKVRRILDDGGLREVTIFASGNIDEEILQQLTARGAPIDGFGIGSKVTTSGDAPFLDCAYKLQAYAGEPRCKHSEGKATWPGAKQVFRECTPDGAMAGDTIALASEIHGGEPLLECVMHQGRRIAGPTPLQSVRQRLKRQLNSLPLPLRRTTESETYAVHKSPELRALAVRLGLLPIEGPTGPRASPDVRHRPGLQSHIYTDGAPADGEWPVMEEDAEER